MPKKPLTVWIGTAMIICVVAIGGLIALRSPSPIKVRYAQSFKAGNLSELVLLMTNCTANIYTFSIAEIEVHHEADWQCASDAQSHLAHRPIGPFGTRLITCDLTNLPTNVPLRLRFKIAKTAGGLNGFLLRLRLRVLAPATRIPLNPFDNRSRVFGKPVEITGEVFTPVPIKN